MDWIGMPADTRSKAENHLTWQKNLSCDCVDLLHNGFVQIAKLIWFQDYLSCPSCILHWILFFLTEIELVKICLLQCLQSSRSHVGGSNLDFCVEEKFQMTLNPWTGRSQLLPETFKFELRPVWWGAGTERHSPPPSPSWLERY